jgi:hypothetical protein
MQISAFLCILDEELCRGLQKGMLAPNRSAGGDGWINEAVNHSQQSIPKRFGAFCNKPLPTVAFCFGLIWPIASTGKMK